jgi:hypothetical protein
LEFAFFGALTSVGALFYFIKRRKNMKKILSFVVVVVMIAMLFCLTSCERFNYVSISTRYELNEDGQSYTLVNLGLNSNQEKVITIPETYNGKPILKISNMGSSFGRGITKIVGSNNLEVINAWTFAGRDGYAMPNLKSVEFPENSVNFITIKVSKDQYADSRSSTTLHYVGETTGTPPFMIYDELYELAYTSGNKKLAIYKNGEAVDVAFKIKYTSFMPS